MISIIATEREKEIYDSYIKSLADCFDAMNSLLIKINSRAGLTEEEQVLYKVVQIRKDDMNTNMSKLKPSINKKQ